MRKLILCLNCCIIDDIGFVVNMEFRMIREIGRVV